jgi:hypothetical protein
MKVTRNIFLLSGKYRVLITRRPKNIYGGRYESLSEAIMIRDRLEREHTPGKAGAKCKTFHRTMQVLRNACAGGLPILFRFSE